MNSKKVERKVKCWTCGKVRKKSNNYICKNCNEKRQRKEIKMNKKELLKQMRSLYVRIENDLIRMNSKAPEGLSEMRDLILEQIFYGSEVEDE
tara:strand:+ start:5619 stop:5897 length:279 start_codon:yes stop_codon:yes gene_type:complete